ARPSSIDHAGSEPDRGRGERRVAKEAVLGFVFVIVPEIKDQECLVDEGGVAETGPDRIEASFARGIAPASLERVSSAHPSRPPRGSADPRRRGFLKPVVASRQSKGRATRAARPTPHQRGMVKTAANVARIARPGLINGKSTFEAGPLSAAIEPNRSNHLTHR